MRLRTLSALLVVVALLATAIVAGIGFGSDADLVERWVSDTPRNVEVNHHPIGAGPDGRIVVAPVTTGAGAALTNTSCSLVRLGPGNGEVRWRASVDPEACYLHALTGPTIGNVDDDPALEVVVANTEDELVAHAAADGDREFAVPLDTFGYAPPTIANLTSTPGTEVVATTINGEVVLVNDGRVLWRRTLNSSVFAKPRAADFDADGHPEVLVAGGDLTVLLSNTGHVEWRAPAEAFSVAVGDVDGDPAIEVFASGREGVVALDGASGREEWSVDTAGSVSARHLADPDGDGRSHLYAGVFGGRVVAFDAATGREAWARRIVAGDDVRMPAPGIGDVDGDGAPAVVAVANDGTVVVLSPDDGSELASYRREVPIWTYPTVADLDGDGDAEVLVRYGDGRVVALDYAS